MSNLYRMMCWTKTGARYMTVLPLASRREGGSHPRRTKLPVVDMDCGDAVHCASSFSSFFGVAAAGDEGGPDKIILIGNVISLLLRA